MTEKTLNSLIPDRANANRGTKRGRKALEASLKKYGAGRSILIDRNGRIIAGNKTVEAAGKIGIENVIVVPTDGKQIVAVQRMDLDIDSVAGRELAYADNRVGELSLDWDPAQMLADIDAGIDLSSMFEKDELDTMLAELGANDKSNNDAEPQVDRAEELRQKWQVESGQLWQLGEHRLICGDCTDAAVVGKVLQGEKPMLMVTDPPYGVNYDANWRNEAAEAGFLSFSPKRTGIVTNDDRVDWSSAYALFPGDVIYAWSPPGDHSILTGLALQKAEFQIRNQIIWVKPHFPISRGHYTYQHEPCWYGVRKGGQAHWIGPKNASTTWKISLDKNVDGGHSTQKPLDCMKIPISNHKGDVYEPFLGSGTTLIACEQLGRRCRAVEISPGYVAVALERWNTATGKIPSIIDVSNA